MRTFTISVVLVLAGLCFAGWLGTGTAGQNLRFMAFCTDGDADLTGWLTSREEAYMAGRDHERAFRGHRWEVLTIGAGPRMTEPSCAFFAESSRENTVLLVNTCSECKMFRLRRTMGNDPPKEKDVKFKAKSTRGFRSLPGWLLTVVGESDCPE